MLSDLSARMSIRTKIGHPYETSTEVKIVTTPVETPIDIVTTTRTHPLGAMTDFLRPRRTAATRVGSMVESTCGWCSNIDFPRGTMAPREAKTGSGAQHIRAD